MTKIKTMEPEKSLGLETFERPFFNPWMPLNRLFEKNWLSPSRWAEEGERMFIPVFDVCEDDKAFLFVLELPGVEKSDIRIQYEKGALTVTGTREQKKMEGVNWLSVERRFGSFYRSWQMPTDVEFDKAEAFFDNGLLRIKLPKVPETKPLPIEIK